MKRALSTIVQACPPLYRQINRVRKFRLHEPNMNLKHRVLGSSYGGWGVPENYLNSQSIVYSVGTGEDISFDLALVEAYGCSVFAFDPTPIAVEFMKKTAMPDRLEFLPIGLASRDGQETFFTPQIPGFHSFSKTVDTNQGKSTECHCEVLTLKSMMKRLNHRQVDLVKMDIEGFEYDVIEELVSSGVRPRCLLIEFHHLEYGIGTPPTLTAVQRLLAAGYRIFWMSHFGREYGFFLGN